MLNHFDFRFVANKKWKGVSLTATYTTFVFHSASEWIIGKRGFSPWSHDEGNPGDRDTPYREQPHPLWYVQNLVQRISQRRLNTFHLLSCVLYHVMYLVSGDMSPFFMTWTKHFIELFKFAFYIRTWQNDNRRQIKSPQWSFLEL